MKISRARISYSFLLEYTVFTQPYIFRYFGGESERLGREGNKNEEKEIFDFETNSTHSIDRISLGHLVAFYFHGSCLDLIFIYFDAFAQIQYTFAYRFNWICFFCWSEDKRFYHHKMKILRIGIYQCVGPDDGKKISHFLAFLKFKSVAYIDKSTGSSIICISPTLPFSFSLSLIFVDVRLLFLQFQKCPGKYRNKRDTNCQKKARTHISFFLFVENIFIPKPSNQTKYIAKLTESSLSTFVTRKSTIWMWICHVANGKCFLPCLSVYLVLYTQLFK